MPHLTHTCSCGRVIHWPKHRKIGDRWRCRKCGEIARLVAPGSGGEEGKIAASRMKAAAHNKDYIKASKPQAARPSADGSRTTRPPARQAVTAPAAGPCAASFCCGGSSHPDVAILRRFREEWLRQGWLGRGIIRCYERFSPPFTVFLREHKYWRRMITACVRLAAVLVRRALGHGD